nr:MAG TPA_asm: Protein of unknown function (DUF739) [Caudoviricetes sp.]
MSTRHLYDLEARTGLGPTRIARLLGVAYITYAHWRSGTNTMKLNHQRHVEALMRLPDDTLNDLIREHVDGSEG